MSAWKLISPGYGLLAFAKSAGRVLCFFFTSNMILKIPSSLNNPLPDSKIVGKTEGDILPSQQLVATTCFRRPHPFLTSSFKTNSFLFYMTRVVSFLSKCTESHTHLKSRDKTLNSYHPNQEKEEKQGGESEL